MEALNGFIIQQMLSTIHTQQERAQQAKVQEHQDSW